MGNSNDDTAASGFLLLLLVLVATALAYVAQASTGTRFQGSYPVVKPMVHATFRFQPQRVEIKLADTPLPAKRIVVFAYDENERQVCILKPVYDRTIVLTEDDHPDYRVRFKNGKVDEYDLLHGHRGLGSRTNFLDLLNAAKESGRRYGVQECLYPLCTQCLDVCVVRKFFVLEMAVSEDGRIYPIFRNEGCPRCGKCMAVCNQYVICKPSDLPPKIQSGIEEEKIPDEGPDLQRTLERNFSY
jgi:ferredoxin